MENKTILGIIAFSIIAILGISMISAFGMGNGFLNKNITDEERETMQENQDAIRTAIQNNDFASWQTLMNQRIALMQSQITQENFDAMVLQHQNMEEFHTAMQEAKESGDYTQVNALREELGIQNMGKGFGKGSGMHKGNGMGMNQIIDSE